MKLAVLGSPINHSLSPALHKAAYEQLGLPHKFEAIEVSIIFQKSHKEPNQ